MNPKQFTEIIDLEAPRRVKQLLDFLYANLGMKLQLNTIAAEIFGDASDRSIYALDELIQRAKAFLRDNKLADKYELKNVGSGGITLISIVAEDETQVFFEQSDSVEQIIKDYNLTEKEANIFRLLYVNKGKLLKDKYISKMADVLESQVTYKIMVIRDKLRNLPDLEIVNVFGGGYKLLDTNEPEEFSIDNIENLDTPGEQIKELLILLRSKIGRLIMREEVENLLWPGIPSEKCVGRIKNLIFSTNNFLSETKGLNHLEIRTLSPYAFSLHDKRTNINDKINELETPNPQHIIELITVGCDFTLTEFMLFNSVYSTLSGEKKFISNGELIEIIKVTLENEEPDLRSTILRLKRKLERRYSRFVLKNYREKGYGLIEASDEDQQASFEQ